MIPSDIRLYTWVDVEEVLLRMQEQNNWPQWLVWARGYWDELTLGIRPGNREIATNWLEEVYDTRFQIDSEEEMILGWIVLESLTEDERTLRVFFEETEESPPNPRLTPSLARPGVLWQPSQDPEVPDIFPEDFPPVVAFHSFKGGVGRTTHTLALAEVLVAAKQRVLLVDGDIEAPGISWVFERRLPSPPVCFVDLLALAHGDSSPEAENAVKLVAERLQSALIDGIYILPSFRSTKKFTSLEIRPEHLIGGAKNPFILTNILASLGRALEVDVVLIDLRAGLSELATGLILDPRVYRIFVTTLSGQSISGTIQLLELIGKRAPSTREEDPLPAWIFTQVPEDKLFKDLVAKSENKLLEAAQPFLGENSDPVSVITPFADSLLVLPETWEEIIIRLQRSGIVDALRSLLEWLPTQQSESIDRTSIPSLRSQREQLCKLAKRLVYAETAEVEDFLATNSLRNLASDHQRQVPITVIVGAKGSGKTYTFLQIIRRNDWQTFAQNAEAKAVNIEASICPVLASKNLSNSGKELVKKGRNFAANNLEFALPQDDIEINIRDQIGNNDKQEINEGEWREFWLDVMSWSVGFQSQQKGAGRALTARLRERQQKLVFIIDGLEDLFQDFANNKTQQIALRALLQGVPEWLEQQPGRPLGILIFIRRDIVLAAVRQNASQMMARYEPYALKWSREEALRLVLWVTKQADIFPNLNVEKIQEMNEKELTQALVPLWGKKLGSDRSREARSANFVITALSDFNGQIQSRDLVRLLHLAAKNSIDDTYWQYRIVIPKAIRGSLPECSRSKIEEIEQENTALNNIFTQLLNLPQANKKSPFKREDISSLSLEQLKTLLDNGVIILDGDDYYVSEIFRLGLNFSQNVGRSKILSLARLARQGS